MVHFNIFSNHHVLGEINQVDYVSTIVRIFVFLTSIYHDLTLSYFLYTNIPIYYTQVLVSTGSSPSATLGQHLTVYSPRFLIRHGN